MKVGGYEIHMAGEDFLVFSWPMCAPSHRARPDQDSSKERDDHQKTRRLCSPHQNGPLLTGMPRAAQEEDRLRSFSTVPPSLSTSRVQLKVYVHFNITSHPKFLLQLSLK